MSRKMLPVLFLSHGGGPAHLLDFAGSPFAEIDRNSPSAEFMRSLSKNVVDKFNKTGNKVDCILVVSAHWEEPQFTVEYQTSKTTKLYYDYYGFPEEAYYPHLVYPAKTDLKVADEVINLLGDHNIKVNKKERGYDHGVFIPLKVAYPEANIPIVQLSLKDGLSMAEHIRLGEILRPLRSKGVLIVASGQITHNLREIRTARSGVDPRSIEFTDYIKNLLEDATPENYEQRKSLLTNIADHAPHFYWCHPRPEHFVPLAVAFGAGFTHHDVAESTSELEEGKSGADVEGSFAAEVDGSAAVIADSCSENGNAFCRRIYHEVAVGSMAVDSYVFL